MSSIPQKLYHYTSKANASAIERSGVIRSAHDDPRHTRFGPGVYLSHVHPRSDDRDIVSANWGGQVRPEKIESAIEVDTRNLNVRIYQENNRMVYKADGDVRLRSDYKRIDRK